MSRQQIVVQNIHNRPSVAPGIGPQTDYALPDQRMFVGIGIDGAMQQDTALYAGRVGLPGPTFYKICDKIADQQVGVAERKQTMRQVIHTRDETRGRPNWFCGKV